MNILLWIKPKDFENNSTDANICRRQPVGMEVDHLGDLAEALTSTELYPMDGNLHSNLLASIDQLILGVQGYAYINRHNIPI